MTTSDFLQRLVTEYRRHWRAVLAATFIGFIAGGAATLLMEPVYRAEVVVVSASSGEAQSAGLALAGQFSGLATLAGLNIGPADERSEALEYLRSRALARKFIVDRELMPVLFSARWDAEAGSWRRNLWGGEPTINEAVSLYRRTIFHLLEDKRTGVLRVSIEWGDRKRAAEWANAIVETANNELRERAISSAQRSLNYLNRELQHTTVVELRSGLFRLIEEQTKRIMLAKTRDDYAFKIVDPAQIPDEGDPVRPKRGVVAVLVGILFGLVATSLFALKLREQ